MFALTLYLQKQTKILLLQIILIHEDLHCEISLIRPVITKQIPRFGSSFERHKLAHPNSIPNEGILVQSLRLTFYCVVHTVQDFAVFFSSNFNSFVGILKS